MKSCYVVMRHIPVNNEEDNVDSCVEALTENLYLAEKVIANYFTGSFGEDGGKLISTLQPGWTDIRTYWMQSNYKKSGATWFTVYEEEIKDDSALI